MQLPDYWLPRPAALLDSATRAAFDGLLRAAAAGPPGAPIDYRLAAPKWQFLCYAAEQGGLALHGSSDLSIESFEPRRAADLNEFGAQQAVYAAADGIWPMYFAIIDRANYPLTLINACLWIEAQDGTRGEPLYVFSLSRGALAQRPYRPGAVYLLPRESFVRQPPIPFGDVTVHTAQLASPVAVTPIARLAVEPEDFPFLAAMRAHDDERLAEYAEAMHTGAPWPDDRPAG